MSYEIVRPLGRGGMGTVSLAKDTRLDRLVAIKTLREDLQHPEFTNRLKDEARLLAQLNHPNVVQLFDLIEDGDQLALVMEYVDGRNLHILLREGSGDQSERLRWLSEIAAALDCAHQAGIAHRDLKAENVLVNKDGTAKVTDFGIAETVTDNRGREQDIAALGSLAEQMLDDPQQHSPGLGHLLQQLRDSRPEQRPGAAEAADAFRLAWHESTQQETALPEPVSAAPARRQWPAAALVTAAVLAAALIGWRLLQPPETRYVAVLDPVLTATGAIAESQQLGLRTTVQQALQQAVLNNPGLTLIGARESSTVQGSTSTVLAALGADEALASTLRCQERSCELSLQRIDARGAVLASRSTTLLPEATLDSWNIVGGQWALLYPEAATTENLESLISEADYAEYLSLYQTAFMGAADISESEIFQRSEALIGRADRFLPLYRLYIDSALDLHDDTGDSDYLSRAKRVLDTAKTWAGDSPLLYQALFEVALEQDDFTAAGRAIESLKLLASDRVLVHKLSARLDSKQARYEAADQHYRKALAMRPSRELYYESAWNYYEWGRADQATDLLNKLLAIYPADRSARDLLGMIELHAGNIDSAIDHFQASLELEESETARSNLGLAYLLRGDYAEARAEFLPAYQPGDRSPIVVLNLADAETLLGNQEAADSLYREIVKDQTQGPSPSDPRALSQAYAQLGMYERAIAALKQGEKNRRRNSEDSFNAALVYTLSGQHIAAMVEVEEALASGFSGIWFTLPFFDPLCADPAFSALLQQADINTACQKRTATIRLE